MNEIFNIESNIFLSTLYLALFNIYLLLHISNQNQFIFELIFEHICYQTVGLNVSVRYAQGRYGNELERF